MGSMPVFQAEFDFWGFVTINIFLNWYRDDLSNVEIDISFFAHNFFIFENFSKISIRVPPKPTMIYNFG